MVEVGQAAPEFTLNSHDGQQVSLGQFKGQKFVVLTFFPTAFSGGWTNHIASFNRPLKEFEARGAQVLGLSVDRVASLKAWAQNLGGINYPLLSDFWPHGTVAQEYGVFNEESGNSRRSLFIIDKDGVVRHTEMHQGTLPDPVKTLEALDRVKSAKE